MWDFHDLLFHTHSTEGRHANPIGGLYPYVGVIAPPPAMRPRWPGKRIDLRKLRPGRGETISPVAKLLRERHSMRDFDEATDHVGRAFPFSRRRCAHAVQVEKRARPRRRRSR